MAKIEAGDICMFRLSIPNQNGGRFVEAVQPVLNKPGRWYVRPLQICWCESRRVEVPPGSMGTTDEKWLIPFPGDGTDADSCDDVPIRDRLPGDVIEVASPVLEQA